MKKEDHTLGAMIAALVIGVMVFHLGANAQTNGRIAFGRSGDIYIMNPDGTNITEITSSAYYPVYSPDASKIAFYRSTGIHTMNADGSSQMLIAPTTGPLFDKMKISWSPDGSRIAYTCGGICIVNADGSNPVTVRESPLDYGPDWSPDGAQIAFTSKRDGTSGEIYVMNPHGGAQRRLTYTLNDDGYPAWSPDGNRIVYTSEFFFGFVGLVLVMDSDGSNSRVLAGGSLFDEPATRPAYFPDWSPDGTRITYSAFCCQLTGLADEYADVWVIYADGDSPRNLTNTPPNIAEYFANWGTGASTSPRRTAFDFDGDARADVAVFRPSDRTWYVDRSAAGPSVTQFGLAADAITPADYDGDGKTDVAVYRDGVWYWLRSSDGAVGIVPFGLAEDLPVPADYSGDGRAELAVYRTGVWHTLNLANGAYTFVLFGTADDRPVPADFDGDSKSDMTVYRSGEWKLFRSSDGQTRDVVLGSALDKPVVGDYDGDGRADMAVYGSDGTWNVRQSYRGNVSFRFGLISDLPVPADFDGDGKTDAAVYRNGTWWILQSTNGQVRLSTFGLGGDRPVQATGQ